MFINLKLLMIKIWKKLLKEYFHRINTHLNNNIVKNLNNSSIINGFEKLLNVIVLSMLYLIK